MTEETGETHTTEINSVADTSTFFANVIGLYAILITICFLLRCVFGITQNIPLSKI